MSVKFVNNRIDQLHECIFLTLLKMQYTTHDNNAKFIPSTQTRATAIGNLYFSIRICLRAQARHKLEDSSSVLRRRIQIPLKMIIIDEKIHRMFYLFI